MVYEQFITDYTEVDGGGDLTRATETHIDFDTMAQNVDDYIYRDMTIDHFAGDFEHLVDIRLVSADVWGTAWAWALTNAVDDLYGLRGSSEDHLGVVCYRDNSSQWIVMMREQEGANGYTDSGSFTYQDDWFYPKIKRDEAVGANGTLYCYVYSDAIRTTLEDTLSLTLHEKEDFRYVYAVSSHNAASAEEITGDIENLDLQEAAAVTVKKGGNLVAAMTLALNSKMFYD